MFTEDQRLVVPARDKLLDLEIVPNKQEIQATRNRFVPILARDADGAPVRDVEVSLGVIDEAIYSLSPDSPPTCARIFMGCATTQFKPVFRSLTRFVASPVKSRSISQA